MTSYTNADGLSIAFGTDRAKKGLVGSPKTDGVNTMVVAEIDWSRLGAAGTRTALDWIPLSALPTGALIRSATLIVSEVFTSGGAATLSIGTQENDGTVIDADGIDAAIAITAIDAIGDEVACDGAQIGAILAKDAYLETTVGTAAFTAGAAKLVIEYYVPQSI